MKIRTLSLILLVPLAALHAVAEDVMPRELDLPTAVALARQHNPAFLRLRVRRPIRH